MRSIFNIKILSLTLISSAVFFWVSATIVAVVMMGKMLYTEPID
jgi:hypothetical protein